MCEGIRERRGQNGEPEEDANFSISSWEGLLVLYLWACDCHYN